MKVFLCEKPAQAKDYANALGVSSRKDGYIEGNNIIITWAIGHLIQNYEPKDYDEKYKLWDLNHLPIIPEVWKDKVSDSKKKQYNVINRIFSSLTENDEVYIATDAAREGELIAVELLEKTKCKAKRKRVWNQSLTTEAIKKDVNNSKDASSTYPLYLAGLARQRADWLIGMNMTIGVTSVNRGLIEGIFSIGRVQTPTLTLIVNRDLEIENFKPKTYFELNANIKHKNGNFYAKWNPPKEIIEDDKYIYNIDVLNNIKNKVENNSGVISNYVHELKKTSPPVGFNLSSLTKLASSKYSFTAKQVLDVCQSLYETHKAVTYPRTDSEYLPTDQLKEAKSVISALSQTHNENSKLISILGKCNVNQKTKIWNDKKVSDHHAIIPTNIKIDISKFSDKESKIYGLIVNRYIVQFLPDYEYYSSKIEVKINDEIFSASGNVPFKLGWKEVEKDMSDDKSTNLPSVSNGDPVDCESLKIDKKQTKPPTRYTDGTIIDDMKKIGKFIKDPKMKKLINENQGLGTEATRSELLETLIRRNFVKREKKYLISTEKGRALIEVAPDLLKNPETSAYWEQELDKISKGTQTFEKFMRQQGTVLNRLVDDLKSGKCTLRKGVGFTYFCEACKSGLRRVKSKKNQKYFWVHSQKQDNCNLLFSDNRGKPGEKIDTTPVDQGNEKFYCSDCNSDLVRRKGQYGLFWSCSNYKNCKSKPLPDDNGKPGKRIERKIEKTDHKCPSCDVGYLAQKKYNRNGKERVFWGCNNWPKCDFSLFDDNGKPKFEK